MKTQCNYGSAAPFSKICDDTCYRPCTDLHEKVLRGLFSPCCATAGAVWGNATTPLARTTVHTQFIDWAAGNAGVHECAAYKAELQCAFGLLAYYSMGNDLECLDIILAGIHQADNAIRMRCADTRTVDCPTFVARDKTRSVIVF
jgi:hypothetical protein